MYWKLILKSPIFVLFCTNLAYFGSKYDIPVKNLSTSRWEDVRWRCGEVVSRSATHHQSPVYIVSAHTAHHQSISFQCKNFYLSLNMIALTFQCFNYLTHYYHVSLKLLLYYIDYFCLLFNQMFSCYVLYLLKWYTCVIKH